MYDEEPEHDETSTSVSAEPPKGQPIAATFSVSVAHSELIEMMAERLFAQVTRNYSDQNELRAFVKTHVDKLINERIGAEIDRIVSAALEAQLAGIIANGWPVTDQYGNPKGIRTVQQVAIERLTKTDNDYNSKGRNLIEKVADEMVATAIKVSIEPHIKKAQERVAGAIDGTVTTALRKALLEGAGLKA